MDDSNKNIVNEEQIQLMINSSSLNETTADKWKPIDIDKLFQNLPGQEEIKKLPKKIRKFYTNQEKIVKSFQQVETTVGKMPSDANCLNSRRGSILSALDCMVGCEKEIEIVNQTKPLLFEEEEIIVEEPANENAADREQSKCCSCSPAKFLKSRKGQTFLAKLTFACNLLLLVTSVVTAAISSSLLIISSLLDSCVDLASGTVLWWAAYSMKRSDRRIYPQGRTKLEPIAIIILAVIMSVASFQIIREGVERIIAMATEGKSAPNMTDVAIAITALSIILKLFLWIICRKYCTSSSVDALAEDNRHDVFSNGTALILVTLSDRAGVENLKYLDPIGAILVSMYIIGNWCCKVQKYIRLLTGHIASAEFHQKICFLVLSHHPEIEAIDTVLAIHLGQKQNYMVEVHVVLPHDMTHARAHDIGEALQRKLEALPEVERAFVHLDYETRHRGTHEHKIVV